MAEWIDRDNPVKTDGSGLTNDGENSLRQLEEASSSGSTPNVKRTRSSSEKAKYPFICECFFMTARVLNLGLLKAFSDFKHLVQVMLY